ncbi:MAG TPA: methylenetetrahydrofolate reductase [Thermodesulfobacteriota bacterium]|jgi:5,10-methylenetetrahydrofolate reductase|nr:methylenetetrahydrofolate reductase [Thermodesulfobacteriota bacterium]
MSFKERLESGKFVVVTELQPPKGRDLSELFEFADLLKGRVDAVNVPDLQNAIMRLGSLSVCTLLKSKGMEVIFNLSCSNRNRLALQSELLNASVLSLKNVLLMQGDHPSMGDHFEAQAVFDLDVMGLLGAAKRLQEGYDLMGNDLQGKPQFCLGTQINATAKGHVLDLEVMDIEKKIRMGVDFFFTNPVYDVSLFEPFIKKVAHFKVPIIAAITLLKSVGMARYVNKHVEGASIPDSIIDQLMKASDKQRASIEIAGGLIKELKGLCQGVQIIPLGWEKQVPALLDYVAL